MIEKTFNYIKEHSMIKAGDKVLAALSGGPDSVCMLHILKELKEKLQLNIMAAHVNHCLRGEDSDKDEEYVLDLCHAMDIPCFVKRIDINKVAKERNISTEMAGREVRYEFFNTLAGENSITKIALAHNANDQAETLLMRFMRGTGIEGLVGIKPIREDRYIRPILILSREEIEDYCERNSLSPRIDKSNLETIYARNKVRLELIPYIQKNFNPDIINTLNRMSSMVSKDSEYLNQVAEEKYKIYCVEDSTSTVRISKEGFKEMEAVLSRIIRKAINSILGSLYNLEWVHIYDIISLQKQGTGKSINLPKDILVINQYDDIIIKLNKKNSMEKIDDIIIYNEEFNEELPIKITAYHDYKVTFRIIDFKEKIVFNKEPLLKYFNYDKIKGRHIILRTRRDGDKFNPYGMKGSKKIKDIFIDLKIPKEERDLIPLLSCEEDILWIVGHRVSEKFKVDKTTKKILEVKFEREV